MGDNGPATIPEGMIDALKAKEDDDGFIILGKKTTPERFNKGDSVKATEGPFTGIDLIYEGMAANERVKVLASLLGRQVHVTIEEKLLVPMN